MPGHGEEQRTASEHSNGPGRTRDNRIVISEAPGERGPMKGGPGDGRRGPEPDQEWTSSGPRCNVTRFTYDQESKLGATGRPGAPSDNQDKELKRQACAVTSD